MQPTFGRGSALESVAGLMYAPAAVGDCLVTGFQIAEAGTACRINTRNTAPARPASARGRGRKSSGSWGGIPGASRRATTNHNRTETRPRRPRTSGSPAALFGQKNGFQHDAARKALRGVELAGQVWVEDQQGKGYPEEEPIYGHDATFIPLREPTYVHSKHVGRPEVDAGKVENGPQPCLRGVKERRGQPRHYRNRPAAPSWRVHAAARDGK